MATPLPPSENWISYANTALRSHRLGFSAEFASLPLLPQDFDDRDFCNRCMDALFRVSQQTLSLAWRRRDAALVGTSQFISRGDFPDVDSRPLLESLNHAYHRRQIPEPYPEEPERPRPPAHQRSSPPTHSFTMAYSAYKILIAGSGLPYTRFPIIIRESQPSRRDSTEKRQCHLIRKAMKSC